ncbi:Coiled-coil domain-containing protein 66 [Acipenser ruthenus]|uniref:Coiled-coil domain-containing protein 66 n=1 Tax=Acipenser ruthenus TaxID=7906 RepID=A0A444UHD6_ACIRT|nr:Coiled-coil domain-containing protein 66 [Acipenser ruthenus]
MLNRVQEHAAVGPGRGLATRTPDIPVEYKHPPNTKKTKRDSRPPDRRNGKENVCRQDDPYEPFSRTERRPGKQLERNGKKPEWNTNKPGKQFVPASLLSVSSVVLDDVDRERNQPPREISPSPAPQPSYRQGQPAGTKHNPSKPPAQTQPSGTPKELQQQGAASSERPPSAHFIPYVRTDEVYRLDPDAPLSRPSTHDPQYRRQNGEPERAYSRVLNTTFSSG